MGSLSLAFIDGTDPRPAGVSPTSSRSEPQQDHADEQDTLGHLRIGVVGLSVGHVIAHTLALEGLCGELRLADMDTIELSNLNRIPASVLDLGLNKAVLAARRVGELDPYCAVTIFPQGLSKENLDSFLDGLDIVVEECDSLDIKLLVREAARRRRHPRDHGNK